MVRTEDVTSKKALTMKRDLRDAHAALREAEQRGTIPLEQLKRDLGL